MTTYDSMDKEIVKILRLSDDPSSLYAAKRIEELESRLAKLEVVREAAKNLSRGAIQEVCRAGRFITCQDWDAFIAAIDESGEGEGA